MRSEGWLNEIGWCQMSTEDVGMTAFHQLVNSSFLNPTRYRYRLMTCSSAVNASVILRRNMYPLSLHPNFIYASSTVYHTCYRNRLMTCSTSINAPIISWRNMSPLSLHTNFIYAYAWAGYKYTYTLRWLLLKLNGLYVSMKLHIYFL